MKLYYLLIPALTILVSATGGQVTAANMDWYRTLALPPWTPSGQTIGSVWTGIFTLTAISAMTFWKTAPRDLRFTLAAWIFAANALLNAGWSFIFFGKHLILAAVFDAALLGASVYILIVLLWPVSRTAAVLLFPYAGWVTFATYLNWAVYLLNRKI